MRLKSLLRDAIALGERTIGRTHPDVSMRIGNLATLLRSRGQLAQAEELYRESIHSGETSLGRGHPQVLIRLSSLALVLQAEGRLKEAEGLYLEAIESGEKVSGQTIHTSRFAFKILQISYAMRGARLRLNASMCER